MSEVLLKAWVEQQLSCVDIHWQALSGDASFRRYFRCAANNNAYIVALAPPETEKNHEFVEVSTLLNEAGIQASEVVAVDYERGFILQKDLGNTLLADVLNIDTVDEWYNKAFEQLLKMQKITSAQQVLAPYDEAALLVELSYFNDWFVEKMLGHQCNADEQKIIDIFFAELVESAVAQPQGFVHRDYHCRNIMITADENLAAIDFQDALFGPITYDAVSLLRDCYVVWPKEKVNTWLLNFWQQLNDKKLINAETFDAKSMQKAFDLMGLQRHIKVLGVFARLSLRDGKDAYLNDLPTVVNYVQSVLQQMHGASDAAGVFSHWFESVIMPKVITQPWWPVKDAS